MKRQVSTAIAIMFIFGVMAVGAQAQTSGSQTIRAKVPFTFTVGEKSLPAGTYTVSILNPTSDHKALQIRSADGRVSAIVQTMGAGHCMVSDSKLVFRRYGDRYFFAQAEMAGDSTSLAAGKTRAERATERALKGGGNTSIVTVLANH